MPRVTGLTAKEKRFVELYLLDLNGTKAAIGAGYSEKVARSTAAKLLKRPRVAAAISEAMAERSKRTGIDQDYVLAVIQETIERCRQHKPVVDKKGEPVMVETPDGQVRAAYTFDAQGVLKGSELLGRHLKMFTDKINLNLGSDQDDWVKAVNEAVAETQARKRMH